MRPEEGGQRRRGGGRGCNDFSSAPESLGGFVGGVEKIQPVVIFSRWNIVI